MISINGLTQEQIEMLDFMWYELESEQEFTEWYDALDTEQQKQADLLMRMVILETYEDDLQDLTEAQLVLQKFAIH